MVLYKSRIIIIIISRGSKKTGFSPGNMTFCVCSISFSVFQKPSGLEKKCTCAVAI